MILITGANGQLGTELRKLLDENEMQYVATDSKELDITDKDATIRFIEKIKPELIYHCAAYTAVDRAEDEGKEINRLVNVVGTRNVAEAAELVGAALVYISTDYVFDGTNAGEYNIDAKTNPKSEYGRAKLEGEKVVQEISSKAYIIRTSWVFGEFGNNFVYTMQRLAETHPRLTVVNDQVGRPTWTRTLAEFMVHLTSTDQEYGLYHLSNEEYCSWYEFATEILKDTSVEIAPVTSEEYPQKAYRPRHSVMDLSKAKATGFKIPTWQEAVILFKESLENNN
ncbi:dTDP-4-dehydrorhamnose reductase [Carnobacterium alterfunditum]|uniref:dTDP-4-dehydrorhamnose reductase n=1 Tax=Carnobacterium alterfunditum TaxID=28230 RepID=A0A1N6HHV2_9LACT|nr:dTDP-4-dehydrorhamnose reductase [Carnobacterium alterfunditum]SIO19269.1 dTDP-4-dehydrorhamnose reductase [Carnobacterium alterfunditum]